MLSTFEHRCFELADQQIVFKPQTDLAILNYIANYIIQNGEVNKDFVAKHVNFAQRQRPTSATACGPNDPLEQKAKNAAKAGGATNR